jgi:hypothetical protein
LGELRDVVRSIPTVRCSSSITVELLVLVAVKITVQPNVAFHVIVLASKWRVPLELPWPPYAHCVVADAGTADGEAALAAPVRTGTMARAKRIVIPDTASHRVIPPCLIVRSCVISLDGLLRQG